MATAEKYTCEKTGPLLILEETSYTTSVNAVTARFMCNAYTGTLLQTLNTNLTKTIIYGLGRYRRGRMESVCGRGLGERCFCKE